MKKLILTIAAVVSLFAATLSSQAQSYVNFGNNDKNKITYNGAPVYGPSSYRFGLYMGPMGSTESQLVLVATAVNSPATNSTVPFAGVFNGGNPHYLPSEYQAGIQYAFQIRGWLYGEGTSFEQAQATGTSGVGGVSSLGYVIPAQSPNIVPNLFGTAAGQIGGFELVVVPEPTTLALGSLGAAGLLFFRRRK